MKTRKKEIKDAADKSDWATEAFIAGAEWADRNPNSSSIEEWENEILKDYIKQLKKGLDLAEQSMTSAARQLKKKNTRKYKIQVMLNETVSEITKLK
jgi:hypothetical protein